MGSLNSSYLGSWFLPQGKNSAPCPLPNVTSLPCSLPSGAAFPLSKSRRPHVPQQRTLSASKPCLTCSSNQAASVSSSARRPLGSCTTPFKLDERAFLPLRAELGRALDANEDPSALRELLKVLASPLWADAETEAQRTDALELAVGLLYVEDVPVAVHYAAMQTLQSRAQCAQEFRGALEALNALHSRLGAENAALRTCAERYIKRFRQKLARTKSPS